MARNPNTPGHSLALIRRLYHFSSILRTLSFHIVTPTTRERQAFACTSCVARFQSDFNATRNVRKVAYLILMSMAAAK